MFQFKVCKLQNAAQFIWYINAHTFSKTTTNKNKMRKCVTKNIGTTKSFEFIALNLNFSAIFFSSYLPLFFLPSLSITLTLSLCLYAFPYFLLEFIIIFVFFFCMLTLPDGQTLENESGVYSFYWNVMTTSFSHSFLFSTLFVVRITCFSIFSARQNAALLNDNENKMKRKGKTCRCRYIPDENRSWAEL